MKNQIEQSNAIYLYNANLLIQTFLSMSFVSTENNIQALKQKQNIFFLKITVEVAALAAFDFLN